MKARKPIRRSRPVKLKSLRYEVVDGAYKRYPDGREVCLENARGREEYRWRVQLMHALQEGKCGLQRYGECLWPNRQMDFIPQSPYQATFEHFNKRGAGKRNDSIAPETKNCAAHAVCNGALGSRRLG